MQMFNNPSKVYFVGNIKGEVEGQRVFENEYHNIYAFFEKSSDI